MLIANIVARNESNRFLKPVLERLRDQVDLIVFTDDASDDATPEIAEAMGADVMVMEEPTFIENEGLLRNTAWEHLCEHASPGDWILAIDADEMLYGTHILSMMLDQNRYDVIGIEFYHMWDALHYRVDKAWKPTIGSRLFRFVEGGEFLDRKLACGSEPTYVQEMIQRGRMMWDSGLRMKHLGYVMDEDKMMKYRRYMNLDGGDFHSRSHIESIIDPQPALLLWTGE